MKKLNQTQLPSLIRAQKVICETLIFSIFLKMIHNYYHSSHIGEKLIHYTQWMP